MGLGHLCKFRAQCPCIPSSLPLPSLVPSFSPIPSNLSPSFLPPSLPTPFLPPPFLYLSLPLILPPYFFPSIPSSFLSSCHLRLPSTCQARGYAMMDHPLSPLKEPAVWRGKQLSPRVRCCGLRALGGEGVFLEEVMPMLNPDRRGRVRKEWTAA